MFRPLHYRLEAGPPLITAVLAALLAVAGIALTLAVVFADAPDPIPASSATSTGPVYQIGGVDVRRVTVSGQWTWPTYPAEDCNFYTQGAGYKAGVGYAVDWGDPDQAGNNVTTLPLPVGSIDVGAAAASPRNPADNEVHPTPNEPGTGTSFNDPNVTPPTNASRLAWRGGCGHDKNYATPGGKPTGAWGAVTVSGSTSTSDIGYAPFTCPNDPATWTAAQSACNGASHVYALATLEQGVTICALMYDVRSDEANPVAPRSTIQIKAGGLDPDHPDPDHNEDNSAEENANTPLGNTCASIVQPTPTNTPTATATNTATPTATNTVVVTATNTPVPTATTVVKTHTPVPPATATSVPTSTNQTLPLVATPGPRLTQNIVAGNVALPKTGSGPSGGAGAGDVWMLLAGITGAALLIVATGMRLRKRDEG